MDSFNSITHTLNGTLVKLVYPVRSSSGQLAGYMCEHPKKWKTFVALQDLKITDEMKKDMEKTIPAAVPAQPRQVFVDSRKSVAPVAQPEQPKKEEVKETPAPVVKEEPAAEATASNPIIVEIPLGSTMEDTAKDTTKSDTAPVAEAPKRGPGRPRKAPEAAPAAPAAEAPKKRTRRTKAQMEEARKAGTAPAKKPGRPPKAEGKKPGRPPKAAGKKPGRPPKAEGKKPRRPPKAAGKKPGRPAKVAKEVKHRVRRTKEQIAAGITHEEAAKLAAKK